MKIYRNGQEIELTNGDLWEAYVEQEKKNFIGDIRIHLQEKFGENINEESIDYDSIADNAMSSLYDNDEYFGIYWAILEQAIEDYLKNRCK